MKALLGMLGVTALVFLAGCGGEKEVATEVVDDGVMIKNREQAQSAIKAFEARMSDLGELSLEAYLTKIDYREERLDDVTRGKLDWSQLEPLMLEVPRMVGLIEATNLERLNALI